MYGTRHIGQACGLVRSMDFFCFSEHFVDATLQFDASYKYKDFNRAIQHVHQSGLVHRGILSDPQRYLVKNGLSNTIRSSLGNFCGGFTFTTEKIPRFLPREDPIFTYFSHCFRSAFVAREVWLLFCLRLDFFGRYMYPIQGNIYEQRRELALEGSWHGLKMKRMFNSSFGATFLTDTGQESAFAYNSHQYLMFIPVNWRVPSNLFKDLRVY
ncbi:hypothetical protein MKW98_013990 [Papaver atlanticum]|uniref:Uncharacterized protein n=1 Tax=Papaver atlanticum TaxID=357466 RepID=A0AAD4SK13_9MAGN|nr:hypothetical protein MKW98_013990 [Papaver atlanticum]